MQVPNWIQPADPAQRYATGMALGQRQAEMEMGFSEAQMRMQMEQQRIDAARINAERDYQMQKQQMEITKAYHDQSMALQKQEIMETQARIRQAADIAQRRWEQQKAHDLMLAKFAAERAQQTAEYSAARQEAMYNRAAQAEQNKAAMKAMSDANATYRKLQGDYNLAKPSKQKDIKDQMDEQMQIINDARKELGMKTMGVQKYVRDENGNFVLEGGERPQNPLATPAMPALPQMSLPQAPLPSSMMDFVQPQTPGEQLFPGPAPQWPEKQKEWKSAKEISQAYMSGRISWDQAVKAMKEEFPDDYAMSDRILGTITPQWMKPMAAPPWSKDEPSPFE